MPIIPEKQDECCKVFFRPPSAAKVPRTTNNFCPTIANNNLKKQNLTSLAPYPFLLWAHCLTEAFREKDRNEEPWNSDSLTVPFHQPQNERKRIKTDRWSFSNTTSSQTFLSLAHFPQGLHTCNEKRNSSPPSLRFLTEIVPRWKATALRTMLKPRPVPPSARVRPRSTR